MKFLHQSPSRELWWSQSCKHQQCDGGCLRLSSWPQKYGRISFLPAASVNQCCAAVEGADQLSLMDLMTDGSSNNTPPFPNQMKNTNLLFSNKAEAFRWNHHYDRKHDQYGDKQLTCTQKLFDLLSREAAYNTIFIYQSIWPNLMWIHFAWTAQLTTTFSDNLENVFVLYCWLLAGNAQGHFFLPICLLLIVYLFLLLELFGNFTRRAFSGPSPLAIAYRQRLHLRT